MLKADLLCFISFSEQKTCKKKTKNPKLQISLCATKWVIENTILNPSKHTGKYCFNNF